MADDSSRPLLAIDERIEALLHELMALHRARRELASIAVVAVTPVRDHSLLLEAIRKL